MLHAVGILIFVHVNIRKPPLPFFARRGVFPQKPHAAQQQIVKVHRVALCQQFLVTSKDIRDVPSICAHRLRPQLLRRLPMVLGMADATQYDLRGVKPSSSSMRHCARRKSTFTHRALIVVIAKSRNRAAIPPQPPSRRQQSRTKRMKGGQPRLRRRKSRAQQ